MNSNPLHLKSGLCFTLQQRFDSAYIQHKIHANVKIAALSGIFTGVMGVAPAFLLHLSLMGDYPEIIDIKVSVFWKLEQLSLIKSQYIYVIALFGTLILTAVGILRTSERINGWLIEKNRQPLSRSTVPISGINNIY